MKTLQKLIKIIKLILNVRFIGTRYFMVFYSANHSEGHLTGLTTFSIKGANPFLNKDETMNYLKGLSPEATDFIITGFVELKKFEYKCWNS